MSDPACSQDMITSMSDPCAYVREYCADQHKFLNFIDFYYCDIDQNVPLIVFISIVFILFIFNILGSTADRYLSPALETVGDKLKLSPAVAGCTLVALANGATDVVAGLVAGTKGSDQGFPIAVGALFGACLFTVTCVLARCLQGAGVIKVDPSSFVRDVSFLLIATIYFIILLAVNTITPALAAVYFMIYVGYFAVVIYQQRKKSRRDNSSVREKLLSVKKDFAKYGKSKTVGESDIASLLDSVIARSSIKRIIHRQASCVIADGRSIAKVKSAGDIDQPTAYKKIFPEEEAEGDVKKLSRLDLDNLEEDEKKADGSEEEEEDNSLFGKIMRVYNIPLNFIRDLTMPPVEEDRWNVYFAAVTPFFGLLFVIWQFDLFPYFLHDWYLWIVYAAITVPASLWILIKGKNQNLAEEYNGTFCAITFIISAVWLSFIANCFMDFLSLLTIISGLPLNYLSLTMLAWGNSLDDFFIDYIICKSGHGPMAVTGVYAGQLFNLLIGFGGSMFIQSLKGSITPNITDFSGGFGNYTYMTNLLTVILLGCVITGLLLSLLSALLSKWALGKKMMIFVLSFYLTFFVTVTILTLV